MKREEIQAKVSEEKEKKILSSEEILKNMAAHYKKLSTERSSVLNQILGAGQILKYSAADMNALIGENIFMVNEPA